MYYNGVDQYGVVISIITNLFCDFKVRCVLIMQLSLAQSPKVTKILQEGIIYYNSYGIRDSPLDFIRIFFGKKRIIQLPSSMQMLNPHNAQEKTAPPPTPQPNGVSLGSQVHGWLCPIFNLFIHVECFSLFMP